MQATNWSLILNVLLLIGVIVAIGRLMKARRQSLEFERYQPPVSQAEKGPYDTPSFGDDIIAVRKVNREPLSEEFHEEPASYKKYAPKAQQRLNPQAEPQVDLSSQFKIEPRTERKTAPILETTREAPMETPASLMMFLLAKENRQFAGYELLQTVLAAGLRFGEGHLFHRHQLANGQGPVLCSLAAATATGVFDLQNIGAFSVRGLCLYMQTSKNPQIDAERFTIMLETGKQLSEGLDAHLLDDQRKPLSEASIARYRRLLNVHQEEYEPAIA
ncbi:MAG: cell division protein ZipA [Legionella sp.]|nr:MAG: cell division protein ZipA [Legionella sp.]